MRLIEPSVEIWDQLPGEVGIYKQIERAGRVCYKSEDRLTDDSYIRFVEMLKSHAHGAMLEHGTVYLKVPVYYANCLDSPCEGVDIVLNSPYSRVTYKSDSELEGYIDWSGREVTTDCYYITTNYRVIVENKLEHLLEFLCEPTEYHEKRVTVHFTTNIGVTREANRHRANSMAEQSTRYCNYNKEKFGRQISINLPENVSKQDVLDAERKWTRGDVISARSAFRTMCGDIHNFKDDEFTDIDLWLFANAACEWAYLGLIERGWKPQQARSVLPLDLNTELVHTAFVSDWKHFFDLRCDNSAHPDIRALAIPLRDEFIKRGYISNDD